MIEELFYFTKRERKQLITLLIIIGSVFAIIITTQEKKSHREAHFSFLEAVEKADIERTKDEKQITPLQLRAFDPNVITESELLDMGLPKQGIKSLLNYRRSGGQIKNSKHFKKMYGFEQLEDRVLDSVLLFPSHKDGHKTKKTVSSQASLSATWSADKPNNQDTMFLSPKTGTSRSSRFTMLKSININAADTAELKTLYGIGSFRAKRIVKFRDALGGFYDINQLYDTRYVPDSIIAKHVDKFTIDTLAIRKLNINELTIQALAAHPYISWQEARLIYNFKKEHGDFHDVLELFELHGLDSHSVNIMLPYLTIHN